MTTFKPFSLSLGRVDKIPSLDEPGCSVCRKRALMDFKIPVVVTAGQVGTGFMESNWPKFSARKCDYRVTGDGTDFVNGVHAIVVVVYHKQNTRCHGQ